MRGYCAEISLFHIAMLTYISVSIKLYVPVLETKHNEMQDKGHDNGGRSFFCETPDENTVSTLNLLSPATKKKYDLDQCASGIRSPSVAQAHKCS